VFSGGGGNEAGRHGGCRPVRRSSLAARPEAVPRACGGNPVTATNSPRIRPRSAIATTSSSHTASRLVYIYNEAIREALIVIWETSDRICGKRLKPLMGLLAIGAATIDWCPRDAGGEQRHDLAARLLQPRCAGADLF
jgi:hypothetical protein